MRYSEFKQKFAHYLVFSFNDIRKVEEDFRPSLLTEWQEKQYITKIRRGYYVFSGTITEALKNNSILYLISNRIYTPSYISFETGLSHYNLIPETVFAVTAATTRKTKDFDTKFEGLRFSYRSLDEKLFWGYDLMPVKEGHNFKIAEIEKVVLDYLYLNPDLQSSDDFEEWRFNAHEFAEKADLQKFEKFLSAFDNKSLSRRASNLIEYVKDVAN